ncbi:helix-hairpin-helix domain-containing protein [Haladaptatus caseinilyticus]|uniref:helix-hairpin-helix domain-containing protein n=1 Tax=Haladaptatus caseinilyticus TaxID=2993314 RepID=UPI00224B62DC|nr:helix-hairpin-helix domain-containing protein [Haladaptatus caseinilyticus]
MGLITRLKSLLGLGDERSKTRQRDSGVTIEREPTEAREQADASSERAVKQTENEVATGESPESDTSVSTEDLVDADEPTDHIEEAEPENAAEPAEATGPSAQAGQPAQTEATEPEPEPEELTEEGEVESKSADDERASETDETEPETTDESEMTEPEAAEPESTESEPDVEAGRPLEDVKGIGPAYADRLRNAGVDDAAQLAVADSEELAEKTDLSAKRIEGWIERAKSM